jgi:hypothetical protein
MNEKREERLMRRFFWLMISISLIAAIGAAKAENLVTVSSHGWSVTLDEEQHNFSISHETLGTVLADARLNLHGERGLNQLTNWSVERKGQSQLSIRTAKPPTAWLIELGSNTLKISCTSTDAVLTAKAPAPTDRMVARLLDPRGVPVDWVGSNEVVGSYGGRETRNPSFLPSRNPEVMYFALGQVTSTNLHSLFDRKTDTAIDFTDQTAMQRSRQDPNLLKVTIPVLGNTLIRLVPDYFTKTLGLPFYIPFDDSRFPRAPSVWCSWDSCYSDVREEDVVRNVDWIAAHLKPYGFDYIALDDGYDRGPSGEHYWTEKWDQKKFPHGAKWLTAYIKSKGLHPGIWFVPNSYAGAVDQHPDWYLRDREGKLILDYNTPALDSTNPQVLDFLKKEFTTLDDMGFEYYKFDGEHALPKYAPTVDTSRLYDKSIDPIVAYRNRLKLIRETIGPQRFIEGCPAGTPLNGIGYFNSYFNGEDMYPSWQGSYAMFSSINANAFLNHIVVYTMAGEGIEVAPPMSFEEAAKKRPAPVLEVARTREDPLMGFGATLAEARTLVSYVSLTGVVYSVSSVTPELPEERARLLQMTLPSMPILPIDLFSRGSDMPLWDLFKHTTPEYCIHNYPEILDLKVNAKSGVYDVVGLTNWRSEAATRELAFADKLGLDVGARYIAFDYWGQKLFGVFRGRMKVEIDPHDTRVFLIHPLLDRPQLIATSRHITGAYSILELGWDASKNSLHGSSQTVPGEDYSLWVYVPQGVSVSQVRATTSAGREVSVQHDLVGNTLKVSLQGQGGTVVWEIEFGARGSARSSLGG